MAKTHRNLNQTLYITRGLVALLNRLWLLDYSKTIWNYRYRFVVADQARRLATMTREERKREVCDFYARLFKSEEALHVSTIDMSVMYM